jgi:hypothetical protein
MAASGIGPVAAVIAFLPAAPSLAAASTPTTAGEAIRQAASKLPGYGPSDVFYPPSWQGSWIVRRETTYGSTTTTPTLSVYTVRYLLSVEGDAVVADRAYNTINALNAAAAAAGAGGTSGIVQRVAWVVSNPNDLKITYTDGPTQDIKVTKRATERTSTTVNSSEFQRVVTTTTTAAAKDDVPIISAQRVLSKWKQNDNDGSVDGIELVYDAGMGSDPMTFPGRQPQQPVLLSKSRLRLERQT